MKEINLSVKENFRRAGILDALRGFALLGICMASAGVLSLYIFKTLEQRAALSTAATDRYLAFFHYGFIEGKFYSLFSLLFGIGFAIIFYQKNGSSKKGMKFFYRRLFFLMLIGLAHSLYVWDGDILFFYALVGALLPLFRNMSNKALLSWVVLLLLSPIIFDLLKVFSQGKWNISSPVLRLAMNQDNKMGLTPDNLGTWLINNKSYEDLLNWSRSGFLWGWQLRLDSNRIPKVLAMFILGLYVGRNKIYSRISEYRNILRTVQKWAFAIGVPSAVLYVYFLIDNKSLPAPSGLWDTVFYTLNVGPLSIAYASTFALLYNRSPQLFRWLQPVGRMSLTNYVAQSVMGIAVYYGMGLGLGSYVGPSMFIPIAVTMFTFQVLYSALWMKYFDFGPLEWIWRQLTYGKLLKNRKSRVEESLIRTL